MSHCPNCGWDLAHSKTKPIPVEPPVEVWAEAAWVACSIKEFGYPGAHRHVVRLKDGRLGLTTACGTSANVQGIWRRNTTKPACHTCESEVSSMKDQEEER